MLFILENTIRLSTQQSQSTRWKVLWSLHWLWSLCGPSLQVRFFGVHWESALFFVGNDILFVNFFIIYLLRDCRYILLFFSLFFFYNSWPVLVLSIPCKMIQVLGHFHTVRTGNEFLTFCWCFVDGGERLHRQKGHIELYKIPKIGVNWANMEWLTAIQKMLECTKKCNVPTTIHFFVFLNGCKSFNIKPMKTKHRDFVQLDVLFLTESYASINKIEGTSSRSSRYESERG